MAKHVKSTVLKKKKKKILSQDVQKNVASKEEPNDFFFLYANASQEMHLAEKEPVWGWGVLLFFFFFYFSSDQRNNSDQIHTQFPFALLD